MIGAAANAATSVRLDAEEVQALRAALQSAGNPEAFLFGSRTNPQRRGGDIDILVFSETPPFELSRRITTQFFMRCEEKIDVVVLNPQDLTPEQTAFLSMLQPVRFS